jgi:hypothetical protein
MKFHYEFDIKKLSTPIHHQHQLLLMGSCFTENIGEKLKKYKFTVSENPHGILFNPVSAADALKDYIINRKYSEDDLFYYNETWHSWKHHSRFSGITAEESLRKINSSIQSAHRFLKEADYLLMTLGSSWVYSLTDKALNATAGFVAANNHKAPADWFKKRLMQPEEVVQLLNDTLQQLFSFNPQLKVLFTISPVRHLREGVVENNRSKAVLIQAVHQLVEQYDQLYYFPAYELVIDDLRDYRFYAEDLVHPNYQATQYVWEKFTGACMNEDTRSLMKQIEEIDLAFRHRPFNPDTVQHRKFLQVYWEKTKELQALYPYLDFSGELHYFETGIS